MEMLPFLNLISVQITDSKPLTTILVSSCVTRVRNLIGNHERKDIVGRTIFRLGDVSIETALSKMWSESMN
jgi:hypothetical protein